jgi:hypothetical protein
MAHRKTLNEKQLTVLRWIDAGCPDGVMEGYAHRVSAAALRARGLLTISGRGPTWTANITKAGREYLDRAAGPDPPLPRQPSNSVTQQLVDDVIAAQGSLRVPRKQYCQQGAVDYQRRAELAGRYGKVPAGKHLAVRVVSSDELLIELADADAHSVRPLEPVPVPDKVTRYHPTVKQFKQRAERHEISRSALPRTLRILQGVVMETERRGYNVGLPTTHEPARHGRHGWTGKRDGHLCISVNGSTEAVRIHEEGLQSRTYWEQQTRRTPMDSAASPGARCRR